MFGFEITTWIALGVVMGLVVGLMTRTRPWAYMLVGAGGALLGGYATRLTAPRLFVHHGYSALALMMAGLLAAVLLVLVAASVRGDRRID